MPDRPTHINLLHSRSPGHIVPNKMRHERVREMPAHPAEKEEAIRVQGHDQRGVFSRVEILGSQEEQPFEVTPQSGAKGVLLEAVLEDGGGDVAEPTEDNNTGKEDVPRA